MPGGSPTRTCVGSRAPTPEAGAGMMSLSLCFLETADLASFLLGQWVSEHWPQGLLLLPVSLP